MEAYVYILKNKDGGFYIGSTNNLKRRLKQHTIGHTQTTRLRGYNELVLVQSYNNLNIARKIEYKIKKFKRKDYIEKMILDGYIKIS